ncbi:uncharacterized protein [Euphorbia lathyris]|uniref:uncharacterized protein n=1 Tax=Euphorbia lathyris TaxID=212925 RepID=UPI0033142643
MSLKMVLVKIYLHYGGSWSNDPHIGYINGSFAIKENFDIDFLNIIDLKALYHDDLKFHNVSELLCLEPGRSLKSGRLFVLDGDASIRRLLSLITRKKNVIHIYASHTVDEPILVTDILALPSVEMDGVNDSVDVEGAIGVREEGNVEAGDVDVEQMPVGVGEVDVEGNVNVEHVDIGNVRKEDANVGADVEVTVEADVEEGEGLENLQNPADKAKRRRCQGVDKKKRVVNVGYMGITGLNA